MQSVCFHSIQETTDHDLSTVYRLKAKIKGQNAVGVTLGDSSP